MFPAHAVFDALAYFVGARLYFVARRRGDVIESPTRWSVITAAILGAAIGSRLLFLLEDPAATWAHHADPLFLMGGKTVVGALAGGWAAVEITKKWIGVRQRTGDLFAVPLAIGIAIGRIGCFLTGLPDHTYGNPSTLPWAVDFGDGVPRHPVQLYESAAMLMLAFALSRWSRRPHVQGDLFRGFMAAYMAWRVLIDALKPEVRVFAGLSSIQWAALAVLLCCAHDVARWIRRLSRQSLPEAP